MSDHIGPRPSPDDNDFTPAEFADTAEQVRRTFAKQTEPVEVAPDAYARLAERVAAETKTPSFVPAWLSPPRLAVGAVAGLAVVAGGLFAINSTGSPETIAVASEPVNATTMVDIEEPALGEPSVGAPETAGASDGLDQSASTQPPASPEPASVMGPIGETRVEAAEAFLELVVDAPTEVDDVDTDGDGVGDMLIVRASGLEQRIATLDLVEVLGGPGDGWSVTGASSDQVTLDATSGVSDVTDGELLVSGSGHGFEAYLDIDVVSAIDGSILVQTGTMAGNFGEAAPFSTSVEIPGTEVVWVVVRSSGGADDVALPFAAMSASVNAGPDPTEYVVATVPLDDPDGGLNVRAEPGSSNEKLGVLSWGESVRRTPGLLATRLGDDVWWPITQESGETGWVNARFLAATGSLETDQLQAGAEQFLFLADSPEATGPWLPISDRLGFTVVFGAEVVRLPSSTLQEPAGWSDPVLANRSLSERVSPPPLSRNELTVTPNANDFLDPSMEDVALRYFAGLPSVTATYLGSDGQTHATHLFFELAPTGHRYVGVIIETSKL